jgi:hypothetical protein
VYRIFVYWFDRNLKSYLIVMCWKLLQLIKVGGVQILPYTDASHVTTPCKQPFKALCPKLRVILVQLTFGLWDHELIQAFRIRDKAE